MSASKAVPNPQPPQAKVVESFRSKVVECSCSKSMSMMVEAASHHRSECKRWDDSGKYAIAVETTLV